jgi:hypothetical protein
MSIAFAGSELERGGAHAAIDTFCRDELTALNVACRDGQLPFARWVGRVRDVVRGVEETARMLPAGMPRRGLLTPLGFIACSAERHAQVRGAQPGDVLALLPGLPEALGISAGAEHIPYLTAYELWLDNDAPPMSFTGEPHHRFFHDSVRTQVDCHAVANDVFRQIVNGNYVIGTSQCAVMASVACSSLDSARKQYQAMKHDMSWQQFNEFRGWLPATRVAGEIFAGPNAAYLHDMMCTDIVLGTADETYKQQIAEAMPYLSTGGGRTVICDMNRWTVFDAAADAIGLVDATTAVCTPAPVVTKMVTEAPPRTQVTLRAIVDAWRNLVGASAAHVGEIERCLVRPDFTDGDVAAMAVKPEQGTGGHSHATTREIHAMRRNCPVARKFDDALRGVDS